MNEFPLVAPKFERELDNVPGPFYVVKDQCILCALPPETAPVNIKWDAQFQSSGCVGCPNHCRIERQPETPEELELVIDAACASCVLRHRFRKSSRRFESVDWGGCVMPSEWPAASDVIRKA